VRVTAALVLAMAGASVAGWHETNASGSATPSFAPGKCSKSTAVEVATRLHVGVDPILGKTPISQVLCGPFLGPGSQGMVASIAVSAGCGGSIGWAVFRSAAATWQLVMKRNNGAFLSAVHSDIQERVGAPRPSDPHCSPSAWKSRIWHWNGARLTATAWKVTPATGAAGTGALTTGYFKTPSGNIVCFHSPGPKDLPQAIVVCGIKSGLKPAPPRRPCKEGGYAGDRVELFATGRAHVPACAGDPGPFVGIGRAKVLGYGKAWSGGGLRCKSAFTGLTCRNKSGHGFFLSRAHWRPF
jgi:hypothetical protein